MISSIQPTRYPIYILSKGRWKSRPTVHTLEEIGIPFRIVVEAAEYDNYASVIDKKKIIVLPEDFRQNPAWAIADELGQCGGGIPVRNFIWDHARKEGHKRHWIIDDNIRWLFRSYRNSRLRVYSSAPFRVVEDFSDRFTNIAMSGLNYNFFVPANIKRSAFILNTRIYSCILLENNNNFYWRGKYNEDTDLSLRILKAGLCTVLFNSFSCGKMATLSMKGGNTEEIYKFNSEQYDHRLQFAKTLALQHPDCVSIIKKYNRAHHCVDYSIFDKNIPILRPDIDAATVLGDHKEESNEYGLRLVRLSESNNPDSVVQFIDTKSKNFTVLKK